jgi:hypothetical protein
MKAAKERMMLKLRDGGLYETRCGQRARVIERGGNFFCPRSFETGWFDDGSSMSLRSDEYLVREIQEMRWVPIREEQISESMLVRRRGDCHWQQLVTRAEARAMQPSYKPQEKANSSSPVITSGRIDLLPGWFTYVVRRQDKLTVVDFVTSAGVTLTVPV